MIGGRKTPSLGLTPVQVSDLLKNYNFSPLILQREKGKEDPSKVLLNPSDPEATFRRKAGGKYLGYVANLVETVGENKA